MLIDRMLFKTKPNDPSSLWSQRNTTELLNKLSSIKGSEIKNLPFEGCVLFNLAMLNKSSTSAMILRFVSFCKIIVSNVLNNLTRIFTFVTEPIL